MRILRALPLRPYGRRPQHPDALRPTALARALSVKVDTVKTRLARMQQDGVIIGFRAFPNLAHLGVKASAYLFQAEHDDQKDDALPALARDHRLLEVQDYAGGAVRIDFVYRGERDLQAMLAALREGLGDGQPRWFYDRDMPVVRRPLTRLEWRLLAVLRGDARAPMQAAAKELGVTPRTARRCLERLLTEGSLFIAPELDASRAEGVLFAELLFRLSTGGGPGALKAIHSAYSDTLVHAHGPADERLWNYNVLVAASSAAHVESLRERGRGLPHVERVEARFHRRALHVTQWMDSAIAARAE